MYAKVRGPFDEAATEVLDGQRDEVGADLEVARSGISSPLTLLTSKVAK
jgi:hypothetical protein